MLQSLALQQSFRKRANVSQHSCTDTDSMMPNQSTVHHRSVHIRVVGKPSVVGEMLKLTKLLLKLARNLIIVVSP